jgi:hypothetical protein
MSKNPVHSPYMYKARERRYVPMGSQPFALKTSKKGQA